MVFLLLCAPAQSCARSTQMMEKPNLLVVCMLFCFFPLHMLGEKFCLHTLFAVLALCSFGRGGLQVSYPLLLPAGGKTGKVAQPPLFLLLKRRLKRPANQRGELWGKSGGERGEGVPRGERGKGGEGEEDVSVSPPCLSVGKQLVFTADCFSLSSEEGQVSGCGWGGVSTIWKVTSSIQASPSKQLHENKVWEVTFKVSQAFVGIVLILKLLRFLTRFKVW